MPLRMVKKDRDEQAKQQSQAMATPAPGILGRASKKAEEPKSPSERRDERKAKIREARMSTKTKRYGERYTPGMLTGGQAKLDKNKNNKIDAEDFKILKAEKEKVKKANLGLMMMKKAKDKGAKGIEFASPLAMLKRVQGRKIGGVMKAKRGDFMKRRMQLAGLGSGAGKGMGQATGYKKYLEGLKEATKSSKAKKAAKIAKSTKLGKIALGVAGLGMAAKKFIESDKFKNMLKKKMNKKMGGGMMKKYTKGGGADTGKMGELRSKLGVAGDEFRRFKRSRPKLKAPDRKPMKPLKAMGGGMMMNKPMGYKSGKSIKVKCKLGRNKPTKMY
jgi:hypothetical protein